MGMHGFQFEVYQQPLSFELVRGITPVKTEPEVLRAISELISAQVLTQQIITQLAGLQAGKLRGGQAFIRQGERADEGAAFDDSTEQVRLLSQRVEELERRLEEASPKKSATAAR